MKRNAQPTMKDIAEGCGVSVVTVSRALRGDPRHAGATREKVREMAERLGYRPNPLVSALMSERGRHKPGKGTVNLGVLLFFEEMREHPFYRGAVRQAESLGFSIETFEVGFEESSLRQLRRVLRNRGVRGLLLMPSPNAGTHVPFDFDEFVAATIGYSIVSPSLPRVVTDSYGRLKEALGKCAQRGYRRVGIVNTPDLNERFQHTYRAAAAVHQQVERPAAQVYWLEVESDRWEKSERAKLGRWIERNRVEVLVSQLNGTFSTLREEGYRIPEDLAYIHLHRHRNESVTCMDQMQEWIGRKAADVVVGMINRNEFELPQYSETVMIPSVWREGATLPDRNS